jgi:3'(2'), 5'-bisphosphate nucleotidase
MAANFDPALPPVDRLVEEITTLVLQAGEAILAIDRTAPAHRLKPDRSPLTEADEAAEKTILAGLARLLPGIPIVSEEMTVGTAVTPGGTFLLVDPLDGTREYLAGSDEFTVNVALVLHGVPTIGCIGAPALGVIWRGVCGHGAERLERAGNRKSIHTRALSENDFIAAISRSHFDQGTDAFLARFPQAKRVVCGSSLKFCRIAEGTVDVYPRLAPIQEWDIAAGHAIVVAAGGMVSAPGGERITYGLSKEGYRVAGFIASGDPSATWLTSPA